MAYWRRLGAYLLIMSGVFGLATFIESVGDSSSISGPGGIWGLGVLTFGFFALAAIIWPGRPEEESN